MSTLERDQQFTTLPREFYLDDGELLDEEVARIWSRQWLYLAHLSEIPEPGDYVLRTILGESVIVIRVSEDEVAALLNVCRHRGARILDAPCGRERRLVCPYHRWTYGRGGELLGAPSMAGGPAFDRGELALHRFPVEVHSHFVFGCLSDNPLGSFLEDTAEFVKPLEAFGPDRLRKVAHRTYRIQANWKIVLENYVECYHCSGAHPEFCFAHDLSSTVGTDWDGGTYSNAPYWPQDHPLRSGAATASIDGEQICRVPLGDGAAADANVGQFRGLLMQPALTSLGFYHDHAMVHELRPVSTDESIFEIHWFVHEDATDDDFDVDRLCHVWHATTSQDVDLCERAQAGVRSRWYQPGPISANHEPGIRGCLEAYSELMSGAPVFHELLAKAAQEGRSWSPAGSEGDA